MKQSKLHFRSFAGGLLAAALALGCTTAALAASGAVSFGSVGLEVNGKTVFSQGETFSNGLGEAVPTSILYTDGQGGGTTYLPLAYVARLLDTPVAWDGKTGTVLLGRLSGTAPSPEEGENVIDGGDFTITVLPGNGEGEGLPALPLHAAGSQAAPFVEREPALPGDDVSAVPVVSRTEYTSQDGYSRAVSLSRDNGRYVSVTVTNHNDFPLLLQLGRQYNLASDLIPTQVPAGETVTRTFEIQQSDLLVSAPRFAIEIGYDGGMPRDMQVTVEAVQFELR